MWISHGSINRHLNASIDLFSKQSPPTHHTTVQPHPRSERAASKPASNDRIGSIGAWRGWIRPPIPLNRPANPFLLLNRSSSSCVRVSGLLPFHRTNAAPKPLFFVRHSFARLLLCLGHPPSRHISLHCLCQPPQDQRSQQCRLSCGQLGWWGSLLLRALDQAHRGWTTHPPVAARLLAMRALWGEARPLAAAARPPVFASSRAKALCWIDWKRARPRLTNPTPFALPKQQAAPLGSFGYQVADDGRFASLVGIVSRNKQQRGNPSRPRPH